MEVTAVKELASFAAVMRRLCEGFADQRHISRHGAVDRNMPQ